MTRAEAAVVLEVSPAYVSTLSDRGHLLAVRTLGGHRRFPRDDVNRLAESRVTKAGGDAT
jgi:excisionase family DNA binding protein